MLAYSFHIQHIHFSFSKGKPFSSARTGDLKLAIDVIQYYAGWADKLQGDTIEVKKPSLLQVVPFGIYIFLLDERVDVRLHPS